jgi:hypothetical protein
MHNHHTNGAAVAQHPADHPLGALAPLAEYAQFLPVLIAPIDDTRTNKIPLDFRTGNPCNAHDPANHTDYTTAAALAATWGPQFGVGFVLTAADPFVVCDIDKCDAPGTPTGWSDLALSLLGMLPGAVVEISQSGRGLHAWMRHPNPLAHTMRNIPLHIELYSSERFILLGSGANGVMADHCPGVLDLVREYFPPRAVDPAIAAHGAGPCPEWSGYTDDDELISHALQSTGGAGAIFNPDGTVTFRDLWECNVDMLARRWPSPGTDAFDRSSADASLASRLAFWTGRDIERIERLMRRSGLSRDKHDRPDYMSRTIANACANTPTVYGQRKTSAATVAAGTAPAGAAPSVGVRPPPPDLDLDSLIAELTPFLVTDEKVKDLEDTKLIWRDSLAQSHLHAWCSPGNGGKTSLALVAAKELVQSDHRVLFFQEDASAGDLPALHEHASLNGYLLLSSGLAKGAATTITDQVKLIRRYAESGADLRNAVIFFDTLKKYTDLMSKSAAKDFFQLMRVMTQCGATVILLAHTNKHAGVDGKLIFEGVGDVRNDVDNLSYLESTADVAPDRCKTVTLRHDKVRAKMRALSFKMNTETRAIEFLDNPVDVKAEEKARKEYFEDAPIIAAVRGSLLNGPRNFTELRNEVAGFVGVGRKKVGDAIHKYAEKSKIWTIEPMATNNVHVVTLADLKNRGGV